MRRILIENHELDLEQASYGLPWGHDSICYNFNSPNELVLETEIQNIETLSQIEALVIGCDLDDYSFIEDMSELRQLYIYTGNNITNLSFLSNLQDLRQLYIAGSNIDSLDGLIKLLQKQKTVYDSLEPSQRITYGLNAICVRSANELDGMELAQYIHFSSEVIINDTWLKK